MMAVCQNCGKPNAAESNFCRFCGARFTGAVPEPEDKGFAPPRPYSWQTDEFQTKAESRRRPAEFTAGQPLAYRPPQPLSGIYHCPRCGTQSLPVIKRKISTTGWIVFAALLIAFFPLFWIGFFIKEDVRVCPSCGLRVN